MFGGEFVETMLRHLREARHLDVDSARRVIEALGHIKGIEPYPSAWQLSPTRSATTTCRNTTVTSNSIEEMSRAAQSVLGSAPSRSVI